MKLNTLKGKFLQFFAPGYSHCGRCKTPWKFTKGHSTRYNGPFGCFPLCEKCWSKLTPLERLVYYKKLWLSWTPEHKPEWELIKQAVLANG